MTTLPSLSAREQAKAGHPATVSKQLSPAALVAAVAGTLDVLERQQALDALVTLIGDELVDLDDTAHLPLVVMTLLTTCPQAVTQPATVAKVVHDAARAHRGASAAQVLGLDDDARRESEDAAFLVRQLVLGDAVAATHEYLMTGCSALRDWLSTAAQR